MGCKSEHKWWDCDYKEYRKDTVMNVRGAGETAPALLQKVLALSQEISTWPGLTRVYFFLLNVRTLLLDLSHGETSEDLGFGQGLFHKTTIVVLNR